MENLILTQQTIKSRIMSLRNFTEYKLNKVVKEYLGSEYEISSLGKQSMTIRFVYGKSDKGYDLTTDIDMYFDNGTYYDEDRSFKLALNVSAMGSFDINNQSTREFKYYIAVGQIMTNIEFKNSLFNILNEYFFDVDKLTDNLYAINNRINQLEAEIKKAEVDKKYEDEFNETVKNIESTDIEKPYVLIEKGWSVYNFFIYRNKPVRLFTSKVYNYTDAMEEYELLPKRVKDTVKVVELSKVRYNH